MKCEKCGQEIKEEVKEEVKEEPEEEEELSMGEKMSRPSGLI